MRGAFFVCALILSHFIGAHCEEDPWANDKDTILIHASNFTEVVSQHDLIMVEFFTPWCGHCRQFAPDYARAATDLKKEGAGPFSKCFLYRATQRSQP